MALTAAALTLGAASAMAASPVERGQAFAADNCARCHAIGVDDASPLPPAPALRDLGQRYPVEFLEEALAEGIVTGHPDMPAFELSPDEIDDLIAFLKSLEPS